jgi:hypothetical protein
VIGILECLIKNNADVQFVSSSSRSKFQMSDIKQYPMLNVKSCNPNEEKDINKLFQDLKFKPDVAIFDTFIAEEMFRYSKIIPDPSSHIYKRFPNCLRILDNQDFHSLRNKRKHIIEQTNLFGYGNFYSNQ